MLNRNEIETLEAENAVIEAEAEIATLLASDRADCYGMPVGIWTPEFTDRIDAIHEAAFDLESSIDRNLSI